MSVRVVEGRPAHARLARRATGVGLAALIPLPFVDEMVRTRLLRSSYRHAASDAGITLGPEVLRALTRAEGSLLWAIVRAVLVWPWKKLFRTVLYFLTVKDVLDWTAEAAMRAEMVHMAAVAGALPERADEVRQQMNAVLERHHISPVTRWLWRAERPDMRWPRGSDPLLGTVGTLVRWAGGAVVLGAFEQALKGPSHTGSLPAE